MNLRPLLLVPFFALFACSVHLDQSHPAPDDSTKYELSDMQASLSAQSDGTTITVYAALLKGSAFVDLGDGDAFTATVGADTKPLVRKAEGSAVHFTADFTQPPGAASATIDFTRAAGRKGATSQVIVPAPFSLEMPPTMVSRAGQLVVMTNGFGTSRAQIELRGSCIDNGVYTDFAFADSAGTVKLGLSSVPLADKSVASCPIEVTFAALSHGHVDPAFDASFPSETSFDGLQRRVFQSTLDP